MKSFESQSAAGGGNSLLQEYADLVTSFGDEVELGVLLHAVADSYSHEGFSGLWSSVNDRGRKGNIAEIGHGEAGHDPDLPYLAPEKAAEAGLAVYRLIRRFGERQGLVLRPEVGERKLKRELTSNFRRFWWGDREDQWMQHTASKGFVPQRYSGDSADRLLGADFSSRFRRASGLQRVAIWGAVRGQLPKAVTFWSKADLENLP